MARLSAGVLLYRFREGTLQVLLAHPGGPFWRKKDDGAWTIPKGEHAEGEDPRAAAIREFEEETGQPLEAALRELLTLKLPSGKLLTVWTGEGEVDEAAIRSNTFEMEWPPRSGKTAAFPEIDRAEWFSIEEARVRISRGQLPLLDALTALEPG